MGTARARRRGQTASIGYGPSSSNVVKEVVLDQRPESGQVWIRIICQTGAVSEHKVRRNVSSYRNYADVADE